MTDGALADSLNRHCHCINIDHDLLQASLASRLGEQGIWSRLKETHPHLLSDSPVFISHENINLMQAVINAIGRVVELQGYSIASWGGYPISQRPASVHTGCSSATIFI